MRMEAFQCVKCCILNKEKLGQWIILKKNGNSIHSSYCSSSILRCLNYQVSRKIVNVYVHYGGKLKGKEHLEDVTFEDTVKMNIR
jgi:hypothetical protein